jgi:DNA-binding transcriptional regulator YhcF (GntR family)
VLAALMRCINYASGLCFPSYLTLSAMTGYCRSTIAKALQRLESAGIVRITRRLKRILVTRQSPLTACQSG